jgi:hypothetical protein
MGEQYVNKGSDVRAVVHFGRWRNRKFERNALMAKAERERE